MTARVQANRTATTNTPPANNSLAVGELYVEMAAPQRLWAGVPTTVTASGVQLLIDVAAQAAANANAVQKTGDTMTGPLNVPGPPTQGSQAANKAYVDTAAPGLAPVQSVAGKTGAVTLVHTDITDWTPTINTALAPYALLASPTFTGQPKAPTPTLGDQSTNIATTAFVANTIAAGPPAGAVIAPSPPAETPGTLWWDSTGGQLYVRYDDGNSQQWVTAANMEGLANAATKTDVAATQNNVGRNLLHNPLFNIQQRGTGPWSASSYTVDRWLTAAQGCTGSTYPADIGDAGRATIGDEGAHWQVNNVVTGTSGVNDYYSFTQSIEGVRRLSGKTVTVSFWAGTGGGNHNIGVYIAQAFGTGGSPSAPTYTLAQIVSVTPTWTRYAVTIALPSISGKTLGTNGNDNTQLIFMLSQQGTAVGVQSWTLALWGVQLEVGSVATPLEKPDPRYDLSNCQRFYQLIGSGGSGITLPSYSSAAGTVSGPPIYFPPMRAAPTASVFVGGYAGMATAATVTGASLQTASPAITHSAAGYGQTALSLALSADL